LRRRSADVASAVKIAGTTLGDEAVRAEDERGELLTQAGEDIAHLERPDRGTRPDHDEPAIQLTIHA